MSFATPLGAKPTGPPLPSANSTANVTNANTIVTQHLGGQNLEHVPPDTAAVQSALTNKKT